MRRKAHTAGKTTLEQKAGINPEQRKKVGMENGGFSSAELAECESELYRL